MLTVKSIAGDERLAGEFGTHTHTQTQLPVLAVRLDRGNFPLSHQPGEFGTPAQQDPIRRTTGPGTERRTQIWTGLNVGRDKL